MKRALYWIHCLLAYLSVLAMLFLALTVAEVLMDEYRTPAVFSEAEP